VEEKAEFRCQSDEGGNKSLKRGTRRASKQANRVEGNRN